MPACVRGSCLSFWKVWSGEHTQESWTYDPWLFLHQPIIWCLWVCLSLFVALVVKKLPASAGDIRDVGSIPVSGGSPGEGHGDPLQDSCLENPMDRAAWWATVYGVTKSQTQLKRLSMHL